MKKILFLSTIASLVTVLFYSCNRNTPKDSESISSKEFSQIELPKGTNLSINSIQIYENGGKKIKIDPSGKFETNANSLLVLGKNNRILYLSFLSSDTIPSKKKVFLNSLETAVSLLLPIFPNVFVPTPTASFEALKKLIAQLEETKLLATAIDNSIVRNGYLDIDDVETELSIATKKIVSLAGLDYDLQKSTKLTNTHFHSRKEAGSIPPPMVINNIYKGVRLDIIKSLFMPESKKWHCDMTGYNSRFGYIAMVHAYKDREGIVYPYSDSFWDQMKFIIPPMNVSKFMGTFYSWSGIKSYISDTKKLITEEGFGFGDMTWDQSKLGGIHMNFQKSNDVVLVLAPQESDNLLIFNAVMAFLSPAISLIGGDVKDKNSFTKDFTYKFVYKLATDPIFVNQIKEIITDQSLPQSKKAHKIYKKIEGKFINFITGEAVKLFPNLATSLADEAFKKSLTDTRFIDKLIKLTGDVTMSYLGLLEHSFYFDMTLNFEEAKKLNISPEVKDLTLKVGKVEKVQITSGSGNYNAYSTNKDIAKISLTGNSVEISPVKVGKTFMIIQDKQTGEEIEVQLKILSQIEIEYVSIPKGKDTFYTYNNHSYEKEINEFKISKFEVTFEQYDAFCEATGRKKPTDNNWGRGRRPVINITYDDAVEFANYVGARLPSVEEWEYACRAETKTIFNTGDCLSTDQANYDGNKPYQECSKGVYREQTRLVGSFPPNKWGVYDTHGNVTEWTSTGHTTNMGGNMTYWVKGGSYKSSAQECTTIYRVALSSASGYAGTPVIYDNVGIRLVLKE